MPLRSTFLRAACHGLLATAASGLAVAAVPTATELAAMREKYRVSTDADQGRLLLQDEGEALGRALRLRADRDAGARLRAGVEGVLDSWEIRAALRPDDGAKRKRPASPGVVAFETDFFLWPALLEGFRGLQEAGLADADLVARVRRWAEATVRPQERGPNNRAANFADGAALAATLFPDSPHAAEWLRYAQVVWADWWTPGDTYEPAYTRHLMPHMFELGELLGKTAELKSDRARLTGDGTYFWAAERAVLAGRGASLVATSVPGGGDADAFGPVPPAQQAATLERELGELYAAGLKSHPSDRTSQVLKMFPATQALPDRLILNPSRGPGNPYAAFYIFDDTNYLFHGGVGDQRGQPYHYEVDGTLLLYHFGRYEWPGWANTFVVSREVVAFDTITLRFALFPRDNEIRAKILPGRSWWGGYETRNVAPADGPVDVLIRGLRLEGAAGVKPLVSFDALPAGAECAFYPPKPPGREDFTREVVAPADVAQVVTDPETGKNVLRVHTRFGRTELVFKIPSQAVDLTRDYSRIGLDYRYTTPIDHWVRTPIEVSIEG